MFALALAAGKLPLRAYLAAGYNQASTARFNAFRLRNKPEVRARVEELLVAEITGDRASRI